MTAILHLAEALPEADRNDHLYAGDVLVFRGFAAVRALVECLAGHCRAHLGEDPEGVHTRLPEADIDERAEALRRAVMRDPEANRRLNEALAAVGVDVEATHGDGLKQRVQMAHSASGRRMVSPLAAHRDTWGSNVMAQANWWAPVFPTTPGRTIALFPARFRRPVANDSEGWDFAELVRRMKAQGANPDYPLLPLATESLPPDEALPISLLPGDLMCFSGAHLHASVANATDRTRLSFETRTVNADDVRAGRGAPNVDGAPVRTAYQLFRRLTDRERLGDLAKA